MRSNRVVLENCIGLIAVTSLLMLCCLFPTLPAADTWWHCAGGRYLANNFSNPIFNSLPALCSFDAFTYASTGKWLNHEWLSELIFYYIVSVTSFDVLYCFRSLLLVLVYIFLPLLSFRYSLITSNDGGHNKWGLLPLTAFFLIACCCLLCSQSQAFFDCRSYLFTYFLLATFFFMLTPLLNCNKWQELPLTYRCCCCFFPIIVVFTANCHGGFIVAVLPVFAVAVLFFYQGKLFNGFLLLILALVSTLLSALINPFGWEILSFPFSLIAKSPFKLGLNEWASPSGWQFVSVLCLAILYSLAFPRLSFVYKVIGACFLGAAFFVWRHAPIAALAMVFMLPGAIYSRFSLTLENGLSRGGVKWKIVYCSLQLAVLLLLLLLFVGKLYGGAYRWMGEGQYFCPGALSFMESNDNLPKKVLNPYEWGGYLEWKLGNRYLFFIDGRANTLFSNDTYVRALYLQYGESWKLLLLKAGFEEYAASLFSRSQVVEATGCQMVLASMILGNFKEFMDGEKGWVIVYEDSLSAIYLPMSYVRTDPKLAFIYPDTSETLWLRALKYFNEDDYLQCLECLQAADRLSPDNVSVLSLKLVCQLRLGTAKQAVTTSLKVLALEPTNFKIYPLLFYALRDSLCT